MADSEIQVLRDGEVLGSLPKEDVLELLRLGFFRPDDQYSSAEMIASRPLSELAALSIEAERLNQQSSWIARARQTVADTTSSLAQSARETAGRLRSLATGTPPALTRATNRFLEGYLPQIRTALSHVTASRPLQALRVGVQDEEVMRKTFGAVYDCLPRAVCRFISEERFITFCLERRNGLLGSNDSGEKERHDSPATSDDDPHLGGS